MEVSQIAGLDTHAVIGGGQAQAFGMSDSAEFFTVLSDTLYRDKKRAVIREVVCNAWDAHIMMGKTDVPVEITLNANNLAIKDVGPGIAPDLIGPVYCVYGASTKVKDDKQTGGFGLGCKAPFAYSDHFTVMSCHAGLKTLWAISRGGAETNGKPDFRPMVQVPTPDTGITVSIPIKDEADVRQFKNIIETVVLEGGMLATLNGELLTRYDYEGARKTGFGIMPVRGYGYYREANAYLLYGTVLYPITTTDREITSKASTLNSLVDNGGRPVLVAEPNTIGVVPSREGLSFSELTTTTVHKLLDRAIAEIRRHGPGLAKKMLAKELEGLELDRYGLRIPSIAQVNNGFVNIISDPIDIARRSVRQHFDRHMHGGDDCRKVALKVFAKQHRDSRRIFRRGMQVRGRFHTARYPFDIEAFEHSRRLHLRLASKLNVLDKLVVFQRSQHRENWENRPIDEFRSVRPLVSHLIIAPTRKAVQLHARKVVDRKAGTHEFGQDDSVPALILTQPSEKLLEDILTLAEKLKIETTLLDFPKRKKALRTGPLFFGVKDLAWKGYQLKATKETCVEPTAYLRFSGTQENLNRDVISDEKILPLIQTMFPNTAIAWTAKQEAKLKAKKVPLLNEVVMAELKSLVRTREFQFARMSANCLFVPSGHYRSLSNAVRELCQSSVRISKFFFPDRVQTGEKTERANQLLTILEQISRRHHLRNDEYTKFVREITSAAKETFRHLICENEDAVRAKFGWVAPFISFDFDIKHEDAVLEMLRTLKRRHERLVASTPESIMKEAA